MIPTLIPNRRVVVGLALLCCVAFTGCVSKSASGNTHVYKYVWWLPTLLTLAALGAVVLAVLFAAAKNVQNAIIAGIVGLVLLLFGPTMFFSKAVVDDDHFEMNTGTLFWASSHNVKFADMASINGLKEVSRGRRGRTNTNFYAEIRLKSGGMEKVSVGDLMKYGAYTDLITHAAQRGIPISGEGPANMD